jgi:hypothetical protein
MKVINLGSGSQSRIAQACDRCRSKKIRCDGIRPSCTQCVQVGFECKTSDKLSRRAFPRGYTESLEERVRFLEAEVKNLKELIHQKDEKLDTLSKSPSIRSSHTVSPVRNVDAHLMERLPDHYTNGPRPSQMQSNCSTYETSSDGKSISRRLIGIIWPEV